MLLKGTICHKSTPPSRGSPASPALVAPQKEARFGLPLLRHPLKAAVTWLHKWQVSGFSVSCFSWIHSTPSQKAPYYWSAPGKGNVFFFKGCGGESVHIPNNTADYSALDKVFIVPLQFPLSFKLHPALPPQTTLSLYSFLLSFLSFLELALFYPALSLPFFPQAQPATLQNSYKIIVLTIELTLVQQN